MTMTCAKLKNIRKEIERKKNEAKKAGTYVNHSAGIANLPSEAPILDPVTSTPAYR